MLKLVLIVLALLTAATKAGRFPSRYEEGNGFEMILILILSRSSASAQLLLLRRRTVPDSNLQHHYHG
jgi:hypothetical protein